MRRSASVALLTCVAFLWAVLWPEIARARDAAPSAPPADDAMIAAKKHFEAGRAAYDAGDYPHAIQEFKAAEALRPAPTLSYNIGLANDKLGRPRAAIRYYRHYLEAVPKAANRPDVEQSIARLEKQIATQPMSTPEPTQDPPPAVVDPNGPPPPAMAANPNAPPPQAGYDPYARPPVPIGPPPKRRNLWWVWLLVGIGATAVVAAVIAAAVVGSRSTNQVVDSAHIDANRLPTGSVADRRAWFDPASIGSHAAQIAPLLELHF